MLHFFAVHTMLELKMTGNSLKGSRPLLVFNKVTVKTISIKKKKERKWKVIISWPKQLWSIQTELEQDRDQYRGIWNFIIVQFLSTSCKEFINSHSLFFFYLIEITCTVQPPLGGHQFFQRPSQRSDHL